MASCCQSFSPNTARLGWASMNSFKTTVHTPRKWMGRLRPAPRCWQVRALPPMWRDRARTCFPARGIEYVPAQLADQRGVFLKIARVRFQILVGAELRRIDEKADDHLVGHRAGIGNQAGVPGVVIPHRGHKGRFQPLTPPLGTHGMQRFRRMNDLHRLFHLHNREKTVTRFCCSRSSNRARSSLSILKL